MEQITTVFLLKSREATDTRQAQSEVLIEGHPSGIFIPGKMLEAALRVDLNRYLLFVTDDVIFEEMLTILLLDLSQGVKEALTIGGAYQSGHFENLNVSPHSASFSFIGDTIWTVKVSDSPTLKLPLSDPRGVSRSRGLRKYIDISVLLASVRSGGRR